MKSIAYLVPFSREIPTTDGAFTFVVMYAQGGTYEEAREELLQSIKKIYPGMIKKYDLDHYKPFC